MLRDLCNSYLKLASRIHKIFTTVHLEDLEKYRRQESLGKAKLGMSHSDLCSLRYKIKESSNILNYHYERIYVILSTE